MHRVGGGGGRSIALLAWRAEAMVRDIKDVNQLWDHPNLSPALQETQSCREDA